MRSPDDVVETSRWQRIEALFHDALGMPATARGVFLDHECGTDTELRREVEALLRADAEGSEITDAVAGGARVAAHAPAASLVGRTIGAWRLLETIGSGGMGTVYRAERVDGAFHAVAALKLLNPWLLGSGFERRFELERQILAGLAHPGIAHLLDGGVGGDGVPFLVLELVDGVPITTYARERRLTLEQRLALLLDVCDAVQAAHQNLVVHRDLKPGNILVDREGRPKLLDFGIAKLVATTGDSAGPTAGLTGPATRLLTPEYASPEQLRGEAVTTASDVFSLGVVLYELVTGRRPGDDPSRPGWAPPRPSSLILRQDAALPPDAAGRDARRWARRLRGDLDLVVMKALAPDVAHRYGTVHDFAADIRAVLESRPVTARPGSLRYAARLFVRRNRVAVVLSGVIVAVLVGAALGLGALSLRLRDERDRAALAKTQAEQSARTSQRVAGFLASLFQVADPRQNGARLTARELLEAGAKRVESELAEEPATLAYLLDVIGGIDRQLGLLDQSRAALERAVEIRRSIHGAGHADTAASLTQLGDVFRMQGDYATAERMQRDVLAIRAKLVPPDPSGVGEAYNNLALTLYDAGRYAEALPLYRRGLALREQADGRHHPQTLVTLINIGMLERDYGDYAAAERDLREVLDARVEQFGRVHVGTANAMAHLARVYELQGRYAEAEALLREAVDARRATLGEDHGVYAFGLGELGHVLASR
ncbi:MAG TPA: serine/threonine-protein kinase, partial [Xanthomonadales bacterium]|nr:serine/threonine-protein kinase [Xanthomonadales bacterium]